MLMGRVIRSMAESTDKWNDESKLKTLRKFICEYCPYVMDNIEMMTGITENWRVRRCCTRSKRSWRI